MKLKEHQRSQLIMLTHTKHWLTMGKCTHTQQPLRSRADSRTVSSEERNLDGIMPSYECNPFLFTNLTTWHKDLLILSLVTRSKDMIFLYPGVHCTQHTVQLPRSHSGTNCSLFSQAWMAAAFTAMAEQIQWKYSIMLHMSLCHATHSYANFRTYQSLKTTSNFFPF